MALRWAEKTTAHSETRGGEAPEAKSAASREVEKAAVCGAKLGGDAPEGRSAARVSAGNAAACSQTSGRSELGARSVVVKVLVGAVAGDHI